MACLEMVRPALTVRMLLGYCACAISIEVGVAGSLVFAASATETESVETSDSVESRQSANIVRKDLL